MNFTIISTSFFRYGTLYLIGLGLGLSAEGWG